jgi:hypothetical protein
MSQPAELANMFSADQVEAEFDFAHRPLTARKALALWIGLSAMGWGAIGTLVGMLFF